MLAPTFFIDETGDRPVICNRYTPMRLEVFNLEDQTFTAPAGKLVFFGDDHGTSIAIVAMYERTRIKEITEALKWYAVYLDYPEMHITTEDPRPPVTLRVVK